jgi:predicted RNA-binding Zn ribbon-like protein
MKKRRPVKHSPGSPHFEWSAHHFLTRNLALDLANTVIYRHTERREDRLKNLKTVANWCRAAGLQRSSLPRSLKQVLAAREAIDCFFRQAAAAGELDRSSWTLLARLYAADAPPPGLVKTDVGLRSNSQRRAPHAKFIGCVVHSAFELAFSPEFAKVKVCPGCGWLFIDRTRNHAKRWCIASLCGNRSKARRYYKRARSGAASTARSL